MKKRYHSIKNAQMSSFMVIGVVLIMIIILVVAFSNMARQSSFQKASERIIQNALDETGLSNYLESCLSQIAPEELNNLLLSGGVYEDTDSTLRFMEYFDIVSREQRKVPYLISKSYDDESPMYPCPLLGSECGGPGKRAIGDDTSLFCRFDLDEYIDKECVFGYNYPLSLELLDNSMEKQLERRISNKLSECVNFEYLRDELGLEISNVSQGNISVNVIFSDEKITFYADYPLLVSYGDEESSKSSTTKFEFYTDFAKMFKSTLFGLKNSLRNDVMNLNISLYDDISLNLRRAGLNYEVKEIQNALASDDVYEIRSKNDVFGNSPLRFIFAVENRLPALDIIDYSPDDSNCEINASIGETVKINPKAGDPDDGDKINYYFSDYDSDLWDIDESSNMAKLEVNTNNFKIGDKTKIKVIASDGSLQDSQQVWVCIDDSETVPDILVDFYYLYEGFEKQVIDWRGNPMPRISFEDPIKISLSSGVDKEGYFVIGNGGLGCKSESKNYGCTVFPSWSDCDSDINFNINTIKEKFEDCDIANNPSIKFYSGRKLINELFLKVEKCVPHVDFSFNSKNSEFYQSHLCCQDSSGDFVYKDTGYKVTSNELFYCGNSNQYDVYDDSSNDMWILKNEITCTGDRGNLFISANSNTLNIVEDRINPDSLIYGDERRCIGCGKFGSETASTSTAINFNYEDSSKQTFESYYLNDGSYLCDETVVCTTGYGEGKYSYNYESNPPSNAVALCKGGCYEGTCSFAVDCICDSSCGSNIPSECEGIAPGTPMNSCSSSRPYYSVICSKTCSIDFDTSVFNCNGAGCSCNPLCDGKTAGSKVNSCGENNFIDKCDGTGNLADYVSNLGVKICGKSSYSSCSIKDSYCEDKEIGIPLGKIADVKCDSGDPRKIDMCDESCGLVDTDICGFDTGINKCTELDISSDCEGKKLFTGFDTSGNANPDAYCTSCDKGPSYCGDYAFNEDEKRCYISGDDISGSIKCNSNSYDSVTGECF